MEADDLYNRPTQVKKHKLTWPQYYDLLTKVHAELISDGFFLPASRNLDPVRKVLRVSCVPRGGSIAGHLMSHMPVTLNHYGYQIQYSHSWPPGEKGSVILDDVVDTGQTIKSYAIPWELPIYCLVKKPWAPIKVKFAALETTDWIVFPYEP